MREYDEGIEEDPPSHQHQKIQQAEVDTSFLLRQIWTPRNGCDDRHRVHEEKDVEEEYVGDGPTEHDLVIRSGGRVAGPEREAESHQGPETALLTGAGRRVGERNCGGGQDQCEAGEIGKCGQAIARVRERRHYRKSQSNSGRCGKPTVALKQTHSTLFYGSESVIPRNGGRRGGYFRHTPWRRSGCEEAGFDRLDGQKMF